MTDAGAAVGLLLVDKPLGATSHDVVAWLRRKLGVQRVGHAGTLDPLASGLLPLLVGPATRLVPHLHGWPKTYVGLIALGRETATGDLEGVDLADLPPAPLPPRAVLHNIQRQLTGTILQRPPVFSAKKIGGMPAHRLARRGRAPELPPAAVTIHRLRLVARPPGLIAFAARTSTGAYLRALARDIGRLLGVGGCLARLRRTGVGPLRVAAAIRPTPDLPPDLILRRLAPPADIPLPLETVWLDAGGAAFFRQGRIVPPAGESASGWPRGFVRALGDAGLEGVGELVADGGLRPRVVLAPSPPAGTAARASWSVAPPLPRG
jgi:tRNA pseudouridine55 synthase